MDRILNMCMVVNGSNVKSDVIGSRERKQIIGLVKVSLAHNRLN